MSAVPHPMIPRTHYTRLAVDEWTSDHYDPAPPLAARMTDDEVVEAARLLGTLHERIGHQADEVMAYFGDELVLRERRLLTWLRDVDRAARS